MSDKQFNTFYDERKREEYKCLCDVICLIFIICGGITVLIITSNNNRPNLISGNCLVRTIEDIEEKLEKVGDQSFGPRRERRWYLTFNSYFEENSCNFTTSDDHTFSYVFEIEDNADTVYSNLLDFKNSSIPFKCEYWDNESIVRYNNNEKSFDPLDC